MTKQIPNPKSQISNCLAWVLLALAGCAPVHAQPKGEGAKVQTGGPLEVVLAGPPVKKTLTLVTTQPARMEAIEQAPIHSKLSAYVGEVLVDYGDRVKKDQILLKLTAPELDAELAQRQALLEQAKSEQVQAIAGGKAAEAAVATARSQLTQAEAGTARAEADVGRWQSEFSRIEQLAASGSVNRQLVDEAQQKFRAAQAALKEALSAIDAAKAVVQQSHALVAKAAADVEAAKARVRVAEANIGQVEAMRAYLEIQSPFAGVVTQRRVDPGHFVQPAAGNSPPLLTVARDDKLRVFAAVPEIDAAYVDLGDPVVIDVPSLRGAEIQGKVTRTGFALEVGSRSLETIVDLDNTDGRLRPGSYATMKITLQEVKDALTLPAPAIVRQGKEAFCYRLIGGKASKTPIQVGIKVGDDNEIVRGVTASDTVILNKASALKDGQAVNVLEQKAK
jgi:RND family efflux transporter MFP subunit